MSSNNHFSINYLGYPAIARALCLHLSERKRRHSHWGWKVPEGNESRLHFLPARPGCRSHVNQAAFSLWGMALEALLLQSGCERRSDSMKQLLLWYIYSLLWSESVMPSLEGTWVGGLGCLPIGLFWNEADHEGLIKDSIQSRIHHSKDYWELVETGNCGLDGESRSLESWLWLWRVIYALPFLSPCHLSAPGCHEVSSLFHPRLLLSWCSILVHRNVVSWL